MLMPDNSKLTMKDLRKKCAHNLNLSETFISLPRIHNFLRNDMNYTYKKFTSYSSRTNSSESL